MKAESSPEYIVMSVMNVDTRANHGYGIATGGWTDQDIFLANGEFINA